MNRLEKIQAAFDANEHIEQFMVTADGQCFTRAGDAKGHANTLDDSGVAVYSRGRLKSELKQAKEAPAVEEAPEAPVAEETPEAPVAEETPAAKPKAKTTGNQGAKTGTTPAKQGKVAGKGKTNKGK